MDHAQHSAIVNFIWGIADDVLRDVYVRGKRLKLSSPFWQPEYYNHLIRDEEDLLHVIEYTLNNPAAPGLRNWRWVGVTSDLVLLLRGGTGVPPVVGEHGRDGHATLEEIADAD
jgi:hypothetical protein